MALNILLSGGVSTGVGLYNGIANLVGAFSPLAMGALIAKRETTTPDFWLELAEACQVAMLYRDLFRHVIAATAIAARDGLR